MINIIEGDILDVSFGVLVHSCNTLGVMGSGVARGVKTRYPEAFHVYLNEYLQNGLVLGDITYCLVNNRSKFLYIVNGIGQSTVGKGLHTDYNAIRGIFKKVNLLLEDLDPGSTATYFHKGKEYIGLPLVFPKIGAGRGGGNWEIIQGIINEEISPSRPKYLYIVKEEPEYCW